LHHGHVTGGVKRNTISVSDGRIYYKDWGSGQCCLQPWLALTRRLETPDGCSACSYRASRTIGAPPADPAAVDGNEMDTYADDLAALTQQLDLKNAVTSATRPAAEKWRYIGRHGSSRVAKAVLIGAVPPLMLKTAANPGGLPMDVFDGIRAGVLADRSQFFKDLTIPFYGFNRPGAKVSQGFRDAFWLAGMQAGLKSVLDCIKAFSETDFTKISRRWTCRR
jgi:non-heme chloroperoxidase